MDKKHSKKKGGTIPMNLFISNNLDADLQKDIDKLAQKHGVGASTVLASQRLVFFFFVFFSKEGVCGEIASKGAFFLSGKQGLKQMRNIDKLIYK